MTVLTGSTRATELATAETTNNPLILWNDLISTISSSNGVETDGDAENAISGATYDYALPTVVSTAADLEFTASGALSCVAIAAHNLGTLGATVAVEYSTDGGSTWNDAGAGSTSPSDDQAIVWRFDEQTRADWRLSITSISSGQPAIGVIMAGVELIPTQRLYQGYAPPIVPNVVKLVPRVTEGGQFLGSTVTSRGSQATAELSHLVPTDLRGTAWTGFLTHFSEGKGFFWAWRPTKYGDAHFAWSAGQVAQPVNSGPKDYMGLTLGMRFYDDP
jgi:hypothetical protein